MWDNKHWRQQTNTTENKNHFDEQMKLKNKNKNFIIGG